MQERCEETVAIPEGAEGKLIAEVAGIELSENREVDVKQVEEEETQSCWKERMHHHHGQHLLRRRHGHHGHPHHHGHHPHPHHHHKEKKWEILEKKRMKMCGGKKGREGWNSKFIGKLKHKLEKIDLEIESLQEKKLFILRMIQEIEEERKNETPLPTEAA